jgi:hypothetical protein
LQQQHPSKRRKAQELCFIFFLTDRLTKLAEADATFKWNAAKDLPDEKHMEIHWSKTDKN